MRFKENMLDALQLNTSAGEIGITEIVFAYVHPSPFPQTAKDAVVESFNHIEPLVEKHSGSTGYRNTWAVEEISRGLVERGTEDRERETSTVYINLTGSD